MKKNTGIIIFVCAVLLFLLMWGVNDSSAPNYTVYSSKNLGASLLYDTLRHMGYPVAVGHSPVGINANVNDVYIIINPNNPYVSMDMADDMLPWVRRGGRLIFLDREFPTVMDKAIGSSATFTAEREYLRHYQIGMGHVITGRSDRILNKSLMENSFNGQLIQMNLHAMDADKIWFAEYYHGYRVEENFINQLPIAVRLAGLQLIIITAAVVWCVGKRFGKPMVYYEEVEREENEHVKALARLYIKTGGKHD